LKPKSRSIEKSVFEKIGYERKTGKLYWESGPRKGKECGWTDRHGYRLTRVDDILVRNHHIVWLIETGEWPKQELDHINRDPSDNRFSNLRYANRHQQGRNQKLQKRREGKWKGVHITSSGKYSVKIKHKGQQISGLGCRYEDPREAALVYNMYAERLFGPYAAFNLVFEDVDT